MVISLSLKEPITNKTLKFTELPWFFHNYINGALCQKLLLRPIIVAISTIANYSYLTCHVTDVRHLMVSIGRHIFPTQVANSSIYGEFHCGFTVVDSAQNSVMDSIPTDAYGRKRNLEEQRRDFLRPFVQIPSVWPDSLEAAIEREQIVLGILSDEPLAPMVEHQGAWEPFAGLKPLKTDLMLWPFDGTPIPYTEDMWNTMVTMIKETAFDTYRLDHKPPIPREPLFSWSEHDFTILKEMVRLNPFAFLFVTSLAVTESITIHESKKFFNQCHKSKLLALFYSRSVQGIGASMSRIHPHDVWS